MLRGTRVIGDRRVTRECSEFMEMFVRNHKKLSKASSFAEWRGARGGERRRECLTQRQWQEWDRVQILRCFIDILLIGPSAS